MSAMLKEIESLQATAFEERLQAQEFAMREKMQVLEGWRGSSEDGMERDAITYVLNTYRLLLLDLEAQRRFGPRPATSSNEPGYWEEKGRELKAEHEGEPMIGCESAMPHLYE
jgi:hypothetical protein